MPYLLATGNAVCNTGNSLAKERKNCPITGRFCPHFALKSTNTVRALLIIFDLTMAVHHIKKYEKFTATIRAADALKHRPFNNRAFAGLKVSLLQRLLRIESPASKTFPTTHQGESVPRDAMTHR